MSDDEKNWSRSYVDRDTREWVYPPVNVPPPPADHQPVIRRNGGFEQHSFSAPMCARCGHLVERMEGRIGLHAGRPSYKAKVFCHGDSEEMVLDIISIRGADVGQGVAFVTALPGNASQLDELSPSCDTKRVTHNP